MIDGIYPGTFGVYHSDKIAPLLKRTLDFYGTDNPMTWPAEMAGRFLDLIIQAATDSKITITYADAHYIKAICGEGALSAANAGPPRQPPEAATSYPDYILNETSYAAEDNARGEMKMIDGLNPGDLGVYYSHKIIDHIRRARDFWYQSDEHAKIAQKLAWLVTQAEEGQEVTISHKEAQYIAMVAGEAALSKANANPKPAPISRRRRAFRYALATFILAPFVIAAAGAFGLVIDGLISAVAERFHFGVWEGVNYLFKAWCIAAVLAAFLWMASHADKLDP